MKNAFYFAWKAFAFAKYLNFCLDFLVMYKNGLIRKMMSQPGKQTIAIHILPKRSKDNQTMKFDQLIEYDMRNSFLKKS